MNALMLAMAIGDLGRSVRAVPVGATAGLVSVELLSNHAAYLVFLVFMIALVGFDVATRKMETTNGLMTIAFLSLVGMLITGAMLDKFKIGPDVTLNPWLCIFRSFPIVWGCVAGCMSHKLGLNEILSAMLAGVRSAIYGLAGMLVCTIGPIINAFGVRQETALFLAMAGASVTANTIAARFIFERLRRVRPAAALEGGISANEDTRGGI